MQDYRLKLKGETPVIHHAGTGLDPQSEVNREIAKITAKKGSQRTDTEAERLRQLEVIKSLWLTDEGQPTIPAAAVRACIERAARKLKHGPMVREGLAVLGTSFKHSAQGGDLEQIAKAVEFTVPVVVQRARVLRTRAKFDTPWSLDVDIEVDAELVAVDNLEEWLHIAGRRIGLGDWRPERSGTYGRFTVDEIDVLD